jgi:pimeloyl-ACP methyl ester carboxylesterase
MIATTRAGEGEPMVLLHGIGSNRHVWDRMRPALERHHDVLGLDLPGFGESPPLAATPRTTDALAGAVAEEMDRQGMETAHLVGNSMGGLLALELARRGRARTVTAIGPVGGGTLREARVARVNLQSQRLLARALAPVADALARPAVVRRLALSAQCTRGQDVPPEMLAYAVRSIAAAPSWPELLRDITGRSDQLAYNAPRFAKIDCPVLLAWGEKDRVVPPRQGPRLREAIPGAELRTMPGVGHVPMLDHPEQMAEIVLEFASRPR